MDKYDKITNALYKYEKYFMTRLNKTPEVTDIRQELDFNLPSPVSNCWRFTRKQGDPISNFLKYSEN